MNRKSIIFIVCIVGIFLILKGYDMHNRKENTDDDKHANETVENGESTDNPYKDFKTFLNMDYTPDVFAKLGEEFQIRVNKEKTYKEVKVTVKSAELLDEPKEEDADDETVKEAIKDRAYKKWQVIFEEELRYLYVELELKNISSEATKFRLGQLCVIDGNDFGRRPGLFFNPMSSGFDFMDVYNDGELVEIKHDFYNGNTVELKPDEEYDFKGLIILEPGTVGDLYLATNLDDNNEPNDQVAVKLDITLNETMECDPTDGVVSEYQKRDIKQLRINAKHTSYSFFEEQTEGYYFEDKYFHKFGATVGKPFEQAPGETVPGMETTILEAKLVDGKEELPDRFKDSKYLDEMLKVYLSELPYGEDEYRYVYLKSNFKWFSNIGATTQISDWLWLYNRDENNNLWTFGCADDYYVLSSSNGKQTIEYQKLLMEQGEEIVVEAVYIVVPDTVYDLYWYAEQGGIITGGNKGDNDWFGAISLDISQKEEGGIK